MKPEGPEKNKGGGREAPLPFYEFFAGVGMARLGLRGRFRCVWANDFDPKKAGVYRSWFGDGHFVAGDVAAARAAALPRGAALAWASFPCQDLSLAGWRRGMSAERSGAFWPFWRILHELHLAGDRPPLVTLENVAGLLSGDNFTGLLEALAALGLNYGALLLDARPFLPQSRPRVFVVAVDERLDAAPFEEANRVKSPWFPPPLVRAWEKLPPGLAERWRWWRLPVPSAPAPALESILEGPEADGVRLHTAEQTRRLLDLMQPRHRRKVEEAQKEAARRGAPVVGMVYKRTRKEGQTAEVRFDGAAGCLRTPRGGSSRQTVLIVEADRVLSRLLAPREAARLMGVPDELPLPARYNDAYHAMGDGVAVPVVAHLGEHLLAPLAEACVACLGELRSVTVDSEIEFAVAALARAEEWRRTRHG